MLKPTILISLEDGIITGVLCNFQTPSHDVIVIDYDTDGADYDELTDIPQDNGETEPAFLTERGLTFDPIFVNKVIDILPSDEEEE